MTNSSTKWILYPLLEIGTTLSTNTLILQDISMKTIEKNIDFVNKKMIKNELADVWSVKNDSKFDYTWAKNQKKF